MSNKINIILAKPRGFCAGVERAIEIVERALKKYPAPIYVHHQIVHNKYVVNDLKNRGVIFVNNISEIPQNAVCIFSAHGVSDKVENDAKAINAEVIDATCPLVKKVHNAAKRHEKAERQIILVGHKGHQEVIGTSGRVQDEVLLVQNTEDAQNIEVKDPENLAYITQTTLSVDETRDIIQVLKQRFPDIHGPDLRDICFATQNRQDAVKALIKEIDVLLVIGSRNSSNSNRLRDLGEQNGKPAYLVDSYSDLDLKMFANNTQNIGITAGASAPQVLLDQILDWFAEHFDITIKTMDGVDENVIFKIPKELMDT